MNTHLKKNLLSLSFEVILALVGLGLSAWYLTDASLDHESKLCYSKLDSNTGTQSDLKECKGLSIQITILTVMLVLSIIMLAWGVTTC